VNVWLIAATALLVGLLPCFVVIARAGHTDGVVALQLGGVLTTLALVCLAEGFARSSYSALALTLAPLTLIGSLVFVRALGRWL
jgi:multisubunit Na+/H+ antiporter MnhF subunit